MIEIFKEIPENVRERTTLIADFILSKFSPKDILIFMNDYIQTCENEEEKEFAHFYFNMRLEQMQKGEQ